MYAIDCKRNRANCYEEASLVCPGGFDVLDGSDHHGAYAVSNTQAYGTKNHASAQTTTTYIPTYSGELLVRCATDQQAAAPAASSEPQPMTDPGF
jgi:hypothetical protein